MGSSRLSSRLDAHPRGRTVTGHTGLVLTTAALWGLCGSCGGELEGVEAPSIPLDPGAGQCAAQIADQVGSGDVHICLYLDAPDWPCVLEAAPEAVSACLGGGACELQSMEWRQVCDGGTTQNLEVTAKEQLPGHLVVMPMTETCPTVLPSTCNGTQNEALASNGCLADIGVTFTFSEDGAFAIGGPSTSVNYSGFLPEDMGLDGEAAVCPALSENTCDPEASSCTPVSLDVALEGVGLGTVFVERKRNGIDIRGLVCTASDASCQTTHPTGRRLTLRAVAEAPSVLTGLDADPGAGDGCNVTPTLTATTAECTVDLSADATVRARFGYPLVVEVRGMGRVNADVAGASGSVLGCSPNTVCQDVFDTRQTVTLTANTDPGAAEWPFSEWTGEPCDGSSSPTCAVTTDRAHRLVAQFGYRIEVTVSGGGRVTDGRDQTCNGGETCRFSYAPGDMATLQAVSDEGSVLSRWTGPCASNGQNAECTQTIEQNEVVEVVFAYEVDRVVADVRNDEIEGTLAVSLPPDAACADVRASCGAYEAGRNVTFIATGSGPDWTPFLWSGCTVVDPVNPTECTLTVGAATTVEKTFGRPINVTVAGDGRVTSQPEGLSCGPGPTNCSGVYADGTTFTLTAVDGSQSFGAWQRCDNIEGRVCTVTLDGAESPQAGFGDGLTVVYAGVPPNSPVAPVTFSVQGQDCGPQCRVYPANTEVTITAPAEALPGWAFRAWGAGCSSVDNVARTCTLTTSGQTESVTAEFGPVVTVEIVDGVGQITAPNGIDCTQAGGTCAASEGLGQSLSFTAVPDSAWAVYTWEGCSEQADRQVCQLASVTEPTTVRLRMGRLLTATANPLDGQVAVSTPGEQSCGTDCSGVVFPDGVSVSLSAGATAVGAQFYDWTSACAGNSGPACTVTMDGPRVTEARFAWPVMSGVTGNQGGTVSFLTGGLPCAGMPECRLLRPGFTATLEANGAGNPGPGWSLQSWTGCTNPTANPCTVIGARRVQTVSATFGPNLEVTFTAGEGTVSGNGFSCVQNGGTTSGTCVVGFALGSTPSLTVDPATPAPQNGAWQVYEWTGCTEQTGRRSCNVDALNAPATVNVTLGRSFDVSAAPGGTAAGTVLGSPPPAAQPCSTQPGCTGNVYPNGTRIELAATVVNADAVFHSWDQGCGIDNPCTLTLTNARNVRALFAWEVTATVAGGEGSFTFVPGVATPRDCDPVATNCQAYLPGSSVDITAVGDTVTTPPGYGFGIWGAGCASPNNPVCSLTTPGAASPAAVAVSSTFYPNLVVNGTNMNDGEEVTATGLACTAIGGTGTCSDTAAFAPGNVTLTADTDRGRAVSWTSSLCSADGPECTFTLSMPTVMDVSLADNRNTLTVEVFGGLLSDPTRVTLSPPAIGGETECEDNIGGTVNCDLTYGANETVVITADTDGGNDPFDEWDACPGTISNGGLTCTVDMNSMDRYVLADFFIN